ncbi:MAG: filamentous hemagglutinin outer membrane protein, partial [Betaproteobacteria bacterium]|nr:filamentous hemagglutinin outer membrane protein [Betaproteobacteria bacterium]
AFNTPDVGTTKPIIYNGYTIAGANVARFELFAAAVPGSGTTTANITQAPLTITANNATKVYGQTAVLATSAFTSTGLVNAETVGSVTETSPGTVATASVAGSAYAITPSNATAGTFNPLNYAINYVNGTLIVTPAPLTVFASNATKVFGATPVLSAFTQVGLVNGETIGSVTETSPGTAAGATVAGSTYAITPSAATGGTFSPSDYTIVYVAGALTVIPAVAVVAAVVPPGSTPPGSTPPDATPPDMPTGTLPGVTSLGATSPGTTDPSTTDPSTTSPGTTSPGITSVGVSDTADASSSIAYPVSSTSRAVAGLNLSVVGGGVNMPAVQLTQTTPARTAPVQSATPPVTADTPPVEANRLSMTAPAQAAPAVDQPRAPAAVFAPLHRIPKHDRN